MKRSVLACAAVLSVAGAAFADDTRVIVGFKGSADAGLLSKHGGKADATLGRIGFEGRYDYGAIGNAIILASRLSGEAAAGEILVAARTFAEAEADAGILAEFGGDRTLKGFSRPIPTYLVHGLQARDAVEGATG